MKNEATTWKNISTAIMMKNVRVVRISKELLQIYQKNKNNLVEIWSKYIKQNLQKGRKTDKLARCSVSLKIREMSIKNDNEIPVHTHQIGKN